MSFSIISLVSIAVVLLVGYIWLTRGFYSSLLNLVCTVAAGAVAFAVWEPVSLALLGAGEADGFIESCAWGLGLALPFALAQVLLRLVVDRILRANVIVSDAVNYTGGGILGLGAGVIASGILTLSLSFFRVDFVGAKSFDYDPAGNLVRKGQLWVPVDKWTVNFYAMLSENSFRTPDSLAKWHPQLWEAGNSMRLTAFDGRGRNVLDPDDVRVAGRFSVGKGSNRPLEELAKDAWSAATPNLADVNGNAYPPGTHIEGVVVVFNAGSKEPDGRTAVGNGQVRLLLENEQGERRMVFPMAVSSQAAPETPGVARWRYDAAGTFIASVGGGSEALFAFEFPCPPGYSPLAVYVKGIRVSVDGAGKPQEFASAEDRDRVIATEFGRNPGGRIVGAGGSGPVVDPLAAKPTPAMAGFDNEGVTVIGRGQPLRPGMTVTEPEIQVSNQLPLTIQKGQHGQLELDEEDNKNIILSGELHATLESMKNTQGMEKPLRIQKLLPSRDTNIVQLKVGADQRTSILGRSFAVAEAVLPPTLVDTLGERYEPVGYMYKDETDFKLVFNPGQPIRSMSQLPTLSKSRPKQELTLFFRVSFGREVKYFCKGQKVVTEFNPPVPMNVNQMQ